MKPLQDVRIVAVEQYGAGPFGTVHLADLGADVIKIEDPRVGGDVGRYLHPYQSGEDSLFFQTFNRNKRSLSLDLGNENGRKVFLDLVSKSDAVYSNMRGDIPKKLGLRYDDLKHVNPAIVCCSLSGYGMSGPRHSEPAYDYIVQGIAGWMSLTGEPGGPPEKTGLSLVDYCGGYVAALSMMIGIHAARRDGVGMDCDVSLFDVAIAMHTYPATWHLTAGYEPAKTRHSAHPSLVPFQNFETADGWIVVGCAKEKFWQRLCDVLGRPDLAVDERFRDFARRHENRDALLSLLEDVFRRGTSESWVNQLTRAGIPVGPVNTVPQALKDPQTAARGLVVEMRHSEFGTVKMVASPVRAGARPGEHRVAPERNRDARDVLAGILGYSQEQIDENAAGGAFG